MGTVGTPGESLMLFQGRRNQIKITKWNENQKSQNMSECRYHVYLFI